MLTIVEMGPSKHCLDDVLKYAFGDGGASGGYGKRNKPAPAANLCVGVRTPLMLKSCRELLLIQSLIEMSCLRRFITGTSVFISMVLIDSGRS